MNNYDRVGEPRDPISQKECPGVGKQTNVQGKQ